ncbi:MAG: site-specific integrase [Hyphomicrobiales bacterium]|nr:MAG: site-specific integrase [Hyphomicrobiales bacterium]
MAQRTGAWDTVRAGLRQFLPAKNQPFTATVTRRDRKRQTSDGSIQIQTRFVVNFRDPDTGRRRQSFFERRSEAMAARDALVAAVQSGRYRTAICSLKVSDAAEHWLQSRRPHVKRSTWDSYKKGVHYIVGPLLVGSPEERRRWAAADTTGAAPSIAMLGDIRLADLTTAHIRSWHNTLVVEVGIHTAHAAKKFLRGVLALAAEDFQVRVPPMPVQLTRSGRREKKQILDPAQVRVLLAQAQREVHGLYYAFPFLTGVRPSEQLGLLWEDVDLSKRTISIRRMQELDGTLVNLPKTEAGERAIPMSETLCYMLEKWRQDFLSHVQAGARVFPGLGRIYLDGAQSRGVGRPLTYANFRMNYWKPAFERAGLPYVTPHSARHTFISVLQAAGVEVGLVSKLAGHANASITLQHYTQAVRGGDAAIAKLEALYTGL